MISPAEYLAITRNDLLTFTHRAFLELNRNASFLPNWHLDLVAAKLQAAFRGEIRRLIINVPPRSLKSHMATIAFPAFILGHRPSAQIICASYGQDLANKHSMDCRTLIQSKWYQSIFKTRLSAQKQSIPEFVTTANGFRMATSVGGVLTGRGADIILVDDPLKPDQALSETERRAANDWFDHTLYSRLNDKRRGTIVIVMQRLHEDDLVGHVLEQEAWDVVRLSAIAEQDESHVISTLFRTHTVQRRQGEALHAAREPLEVLAQIRRTIGEYNFAGQYQQQPAPLGGGMIKTEWFKSYKPGEQPARFDLVVQSWDTANKNTELSDYSVCTTWGRKDRQLYLLDVHRKRLDYPDLKRAVQMQATRFQAKTILIEDKASGTQLIQELIRGGFYGITRYEPKLDKIMRMHSASSMIENGFVYLPSEAPWREEFLHELATFPYGKHDDQVDSTSQALDWFKDRATNYPLYEYHRRQAIKLGLPLDPWLENELHPATKAEAVIATNPNTGQKIFWDGQAWIDYETGVPYAE